MADEMPAPGPHRLEPISVLWHVFAAPQTFLVLMALLALVLASAGLIPHASVDGLSDSDSWLVVERGTLSRYADLAHALGLLDLSQSFWFHLLLALVALVLVVRAVDAVELAWRAGWRRDWTMLSGLPLRRGAQRADLAVPLLPDAACEVSAGVFDAEGYCWTTVAGQGGSELVAVYRPGRLWLRPLVYIALLIAGIGLLLATTWGWQGDVWQPLPLEIQAVGHDTGDAVRLDAFDLRFGAQGGPIDSRSHVTWLREGAEVQSNVASTGQPARLGGVALRQLGYVPVVRLRAQAGDGRTLLLQMPGQPTQGREVVTVRFASPDDQPLVFVSQRERFFTLVFEPGCGMGMPGVQIYQIEQGGQQRQRIGTLYSSGQVVVDDVQLDVELSYVPILRLDYRPGAGLAFAGLGAAWISLIALWLFPVHVVWLRAKPEGNGETRIEMEGLVGSMTGRRLLILTARLGEAAKHVD